jgi:hypothetical protein
MSRVTRRQFSGRAAGYGARDRSSRQPRSDGAGRDDAPRIANQIARRVV